MKHTTTLFIDWAGRLVAAEPSTDFVLVKSGPCNSLHFAVTSNHAK